MSELLQKGRASQHRQGRCRNTEAEMSVRRAAARDTGFEQAKSTSETGADFTNRGEAEIQRQDTASVDASCRDRAMSERAAAADPSQDEQDQAQTEQRRGRGRPKNQRSIDTLRPWIADGVSRRTWFRKRAAEKANGIRAGGNDVGFQQLNPRHPNAEILQIVAATKSRKPLQDRRKGES
jgi:hypothetical protein